MRAVILALLERPEAATNVLTAASRAAELMAANRINVLAVRTPEVDLITATEGSVTFDDNLPAQAAERTRLVALKAAFHEWAKSPENGDTDLEWIELEGWSDQLMEEWGARSDLIVLQRPGSKETEPGRRTALTALFDTGRPVLVVPWDVDPKGFGRQVAIAWRNDGRTTHAVLAALQWLGGATAIHVMAGTKRWEAPPSLPPIFAEHGINAQLHVLPMSSQRGFGEVLLSRAHELDADLLVLGAFAHPMLFGPILGKHEA